MYNLPYETNQMFLKNYGIDDSHHFYEHIDILKSLFWLKDQWLKVFYSIVYPCSMLISSYLMLVLFRFQFKTILSQMNFSFPWEFNFMIWVNSMVIVIVVSGVLLVWWLTASLFRKVLAIQNCRNHSFIKLVIEWHFIIAFNSFKHDHLAINHVVNLIKTYQDNALFRILTIDLKELIERGEGMKQWIEDNSHHHHMQGWLYEQISLHHHKNCQLWQKQLENCIVLELHKINRKVLLVLYLFIGFNLMAMMTLLALPYQWMKNI